MVYITGDTHGELSRLTGRAVRKLKKEDTLIVCGDFGFVWYGDKRDAAALKTLSRRKFTVAFVDGLHENYALLASYPVVDWNGGRAQKLAENVYHLLRGEIYTIEGESYFTFGGGEEESDTRMREQSGTVFEEAMPSAEEMTDGLKRLAACGQKVDYVVTHMPSGKAGGYAGLRGGTPTRLGGLHMYLNLIEENVEFRRWFFGSLHIDKPLTSRHFALFEKVVPVRDGKR